MNWLQKIVLGVLMTSQLNAVKLEDFDDLFVGNPAEIEKNLNALLPQAQALENESIYLQILSQIALAEAVQKKFVQAHETLDMAEADLVPAYELARVRILLERGRVFFQQDNTDEALSFFEQSYELSKENNFDRHTINAAHMIPLAVKNIDEKIHWNQVAIDLAKETTDSKGQAWLGVLYNNIAQNYIEAGLYNESHAAFEVCKKLSEEKGEVIVARGARWGIARSLRGLGKLDEALEIQQGLLEEYKIVAEKNELPEEIVAVGRGMVYEELTELFAEKNEPVDMKKFAALAYQDLSKNEWFVKLEPHRLEKMKQLSS